MSYGFNNHIKLFYNIKRERSKEFSYHYEVRLSSEMPEIYRNYLTDPKNSNVVQIQGILTKLDMKLNDIIKKDLLIVSIDRLFWFEFNDGTRNLRIYKEWLNLLNNYSTISLWERFFRVKTLSYLFIPNKKNVNNSYQSYSSPINYVSFLEESIEKFMDYRLSQTMFMKNLMEGNLTKEITKFILIKLIWTSKFLLQIKIGFRHCNYKEEKYFHHNFSIN